MRLGNEAYKWHGGQWIEKEFVKQVFRQLEGFGSYGFPESHAVSFALLLYVSSRHYSIGCLWVFISMHR